MIQLTAKISLALSCITLISTAWAVNPTDIECPGNGEVCRQIATKLPLRALPRALSNIYTEADVNSDILSSNVKAFWPVYVFERQELDFSDPANPKGWYRIGSMVDDPIGWMQAKDVLEWKQALVVSYTHPGSGSERRNPVLMFKTKAELKGIVETDERASKARNIYEGLGKTPSTVPDGLISREPSRFVSIEEKGNFYMLPVIDFEVVDLFDDEARYLQLAAAVPAQEGSTRSARADESSQDTFENKEFVRDAALSETVEGTDAKSLAFDIKFVMDMTNSMGPYIEGTKEAIQKVAQQVKEKNAQAKVNYGLVGYRDDINLIPELEFIVKNFTPQLVDADEFLKVIATAKPAEHGSGDYQEEVFAGIKEGINAGWSDNSIKIMVVVGDASSHEANTPRSTTGMNARQIRDLANANKVQIVSVHLKDAEANADHPLAESQFRTLAANTGSETPAYIAIDAQQHADFEKAVRNLAQELSLIIGQVRQGNIQATKQTTQPPQATQDVEQQAKNIAQSIAANALIEYLGTAANPPRDITAWVMDRDLVNPEVSALQVRVLLKKSELNDLVTALETVLKAVKRSQLTTMQFFDALQGVVTQSTKGGNKITVEDAKRLADSGLLPDWIKSLPYKSAILEMSNEMFAALSADERANLEHEIEAKLQLYREINENSDLWVALDERDASVNHVYPLTLTSLP